MKYTRLVEINFGKDVGLTYLTVKHILIVSQCMKNKNYYSIA